MGSKIDLGFPIVEAWSPSTGQFEVICYISCVFCTLGDLSWLYLMVPSTFGWFGEFSQYSCLENPRDGGAWWVAIYGVAESDTTEAT